MSDKLTLIEGSTLSRPDRKFWNVPAVRSGFTPVNYTYSLG